MAHTLSADPIATVDTDTLRAWTRRAYIAASRAYAEARRERDAAQRAYMLREAAREDAHYKHLAATLASREDY